MAEAEEIKKAFRLAEELVAAILEANPSPKQGVQLVTRILYRKLREAGFSPTELIEVATAVLQCTIKEFQKEKNEI